MPRANNAKRGSDAVVGSQPSSLSASQQHSRKASRKDHGGGGGAAANAGSAHRSQHADARHKHVIDAPPRGYAAITKPMVPPMRSKAPHLEKLRQPPSRYCTVHKHPVPRDVYSADSHVVAEINIQLPADRFAPQPRGFSSLRSDQPDLAGFVLLLYNVIAYLMDKVRSAEVKVSHRADPDNPKGKGIPVTEQIEKNSIAIYFERVPKANHPEQYVAYRLKVVEYGVEGRPGLLHELNNLIADNNKKQTSAGTKASTTFSRGVAGKHSVDVDHVSRCTGSEWSRICAAMNPQLCTPETEMLCEQVTHPHSPTNPVVCFNMVDNCRIAKAMGADVRYTDPYAYSFDAANNRYKFPDGGKNMYRLSPMDFNVTTNQLSTYCMPFEQPDVKHNIVARTAFQKYHGIEDRAKSDALFSRTQSRSAPPIETNDLAALQRRVETEDRELRNAHSIVDASGATVLSDDYPAARLRMACDVWIPLLTAVNCPTGNCGDAMQEITSYQDTYVQTYGTLSLPRMRVFENLTRQASHWVCDVVEMEKIMTVLSMHQDVLLMLWSVLHTYSYFKMNINHLLLGPPGIGKSFAILVLAQLLIAGSYRQTTNMTPKAFCVPGKSNAFMVFLFEDAQASMYEANAKSGTSNDFLNIHKQILSALAVNTSTIIMDPKRAADNVEGDGCVTFISAMNNTSSTIDSAIKDRYCVSSSTQENDDAGAASAMMSATQRMSQPVIKAACANMAVVFRHRQMIIASLQQAEAIGALRTVDLRVADYFFSVLDEIATKHNMRMMDRKRHLDRFRMLVRVNVFMRCIDLLYQCPGAVFERVDHDPIHVLMADKYMFSTVQDAVFAVSMMGRQWQDKIRTSLVETMTRCWFPKSESMINEWTKQMETVPLQCDGTPSLGEDEQPLEMPVMPHGFPQAGEGSAAQIRKKVNSDANFIQHAERMEAYRCATEERTNWMYATAKMGQSVDCVMNIAPSRGMAGPTREDLLAHIAKNITPLMTERFLESEVKDKLAEMLVDTVQVTRKQYKDSDQTSLNMGTYSKAHPKLVLEGDRIRVAYHVIQQNKQFGSDLLFQCVQDTCSVLEAASNHTLTAGEFLLYGECETIGKCSYAWRRVTTESVEKLEARGIDWKALTRRSNSGYASVAEQRILQANQGMAQVDTYSKQHMSRMFSDDTPYSISDACLDSQGAVLRATALGMSHDDMEMHPSSDPYVQHKAFVALEKRSGLDKELMTYPNALLQTDIPEEKWEQMRADGTVKGFSMRENMERMIERNKQRPDLLGPFLKEAIKRGKQQHDEQQAYMSSQVSSRSPERRRRVHIKEDEMEEKSQEQYDPDMHEPVDPDADEANAAHGMEF